MGDTDTHPDTDTPPDIEPAEALARMRAAAPLVHCITNYVAMDFAANLLLAAGAAPAMIHAREEAAEFARTASALTVNIGTLSPDWVEAMAEAAGAAREAGRPWVFDPVAAGATAYRREVSARLMALGPTVVRGNASEVLALAGATGTGKGVEAADPVAKAEAAARELARAHGTVVAVTGPEDYVTDGARALRIAGGDPMLARVTAAGCALTALVGAYLGAGLRPVEGTVGALAAYAAAGAAAAEGAPGPGSFRVAFLDAIAGLDAEGLAARAAVRPA